MSDDLDDDEPKSEALTLSDQEREWLRTLPVDLALEKVKRGHYNERCVECKRFIGNHSLRQMKSCLVKYWNEEEGRD